MSFCFRIQSRITRAVYLFINAFLSLLQPDSYSVVQWPWHWRVLLGYFVGCPSRWVCLMFLVIRFGVMLSLSGRTTQRWCALPHWIISWGTWRQEALLEMFFHCFKVVSARVFCCKVTIFSTFHSLEEYGPHARGAGSIYR